MLAACTAPAPVATPGPTESAASTPGAAPTGNPIPTHPPGPDLPALDVATDPQAEALAGRVLAGGDEARAALDAAIEAAGLGIIDTEGLLLTEPAQPSQGLAFGAYEVQALVDLEALGFAQPATDLAEVIAAPLAELDGEPVASMLIEGVRDAAQSEIATRRFWAHFLVELGRQRPAGYDLLREIGAEDVVFDAVQIGFVLRRLQGDLLTVPGTAATISLASYVRPRLPANGTLHVGKQPCQFDDVDATIDWDDPVVADVLFDKLISHLVSRGMAEAANIPKWKGAAGVVQAYAELLFSSAKDKSAFGTKATLAGPDPFERTRTTTHGDVQNFTVEARFDLRWERETLACMQAALDAMTGGSYKIPSLAESGPIPGAEILLHVFEGRPPGALPQSERVGIADPESPGPAGLSLTKVADQKGTVTVWLVGLPQDENLPDDAEPVIVDNAVIAEVHARGIDLWENMAAQAGTPMPPARPGVVRQIPAVILANREFHFATFKVFRVRDWEECPASPFGGSIVLAGAVVAQGFCPGGDLVGTITWDHYYVYDDPAYNNNHSERRDTVVIKVRFSEVDGEWIDAGSTFSFTGNEVFTDNAGDCASTRDTSEWARSGPFAGDEHVNISVSVDSETREVIPDVLVSADMRGHSVTQQMEHVSPESVEEHCVTHERDYDQGREEWPQVPACGPALEPLVGRISDDGRTVDVSCSASETSEVNTGTATETWNASGTLTFSAPR